MSETRITQRPKRPTEETRAETDAETTSEELACPECSGDLATDTEHGEVICQECGAKNEGGFSYCRDCSAELPE
jgi:transcription initiation factor TFIIB